MEKGCFATAKINYRNLILNADLNFQNKILILENENELVKTNFTSV